MKTIEDVEIGKAVGVIMHREGDRLVLTDGRGKQYECSNPQELWDDMLTLLQDTTLPKMLVGASGSPGGPGSPDDQIDAREVFDAFCGEAAGFVGEAYGPLFGKLASHAARRGGPATLNFLRKISRNSKPKGKDKVVP